METTCGVDYGASSRGKEGRIVVVGLCCIDIVNYVDKFPAEDSDTRVFDQRISLGGNAANSTTVLHQLNPNCELFASLPAVGSHPLLEQLIQESGIDVRRCRRQPRAGKSAGTSVQNLRNGIPSQGGVPVSTVVVNRSNHASRTILHYRGSLPELRVEDFVEAFEKSCSSDSHFDELVSWVHFEGRNFDEVGKMMRYLRSKAFENVDGSFFSSSNKSEKKGSRRPRISVELEKLRDFSYWMELAPLADVIFVSKDFAKARGWHSMEEALDGVQREFGAADSTVIVPWGNKGAVGRVSLSSPQLVHQAAFPPAELVDTLAAGDCFIGVALHYLNSEAPLEVVLREACRIAGAKCGQKGLLGLHGE